MVKGTNTEFSIQPHPNVHFFFFKFCFIQFDEDDIVAMGVGSSGSSW